MHPRLVRRDIGCCIEAGVPQEHGITTVFVWSEEVPIFHIASPVVQYNMCVRCISDWLDETQPSKLHTPNIDTIRGTLRRNAFRFSFCLHSSALYLRQLAARAQDETSSQAKTPLAGSRAGPSLAGLALSFGRAGSLLYGQFCSLQYSTVLTRRCTMMLAASAS